MCSMIPKKLELHNIETNGSDWVVRQCCKVATGQKELDGQCVRRVALTIEYDSSIQIHRIQFRSLVRLRRNRHTLSKEFERITIVEPGHQPRISSRIKAVTSRKYSGKRISTLMKVFAARSSISVQVSNSRSLQNGRLKQTPQNKMANKV